MKVTGQSIAPITVEDVTVTLSHEEVTRIKEALRYRDWSGDYELSVQFTDALTYKAFDSKDVTVVANSGAVDNCIRLGQKIVGIKELRTLTGCGLKEAKDAYEARQRVLNY